MMGVLRGQLIDLKEKSIGCLDFDHLHVLDLDRFLDLFGTSHRDFESTYNPPKAENITISSYLQTIWIRLWTQVKLRGILAKKWNQVGGLDNRSEGQKHRTMYYLHVL